MSVASVAGLVPVSRRFTQHAEKFIFGHFLPKTGDFFYQQFKLSMLHAKSLSWIGFLSMFLTAYIMLKTLEKHINEMWNIKIHRKFIYSILIYAFFMLLGPILVFVILLLQIYTKTYFNSSLNAIIHPLSYLIGVALFIITYKVLPAAKVQWAHAFLAGVIAGTWFELAKMVFVFYVTNFPVYDLLYGSLAVLPLFLIWVYICSLILFFCAQIIYVLQLPSQVKP